MDPAVSAIIQTTVAGVAGALVAIATIRADIKYLRRDVDFLLTRKLKGGDETE